jgi:hypothetical protein
MGMGRSRMAHELVTLAQSRGHLVLAGSAYPQNDHLPYVPIIRSLGSYLRQPKAPQQAELLADLPHLSRLISGRPLPEGGASQAFQPVYLLEDVTRLAERLAQEQPLVWCIDDLHLADPASTELFCYLARNIRSQRVLLLATYRNDAADGPRHFRVPLLTLAHLGLSEEVPLQRLAPTDMALLASQRLGSRPAQTLLEYLEARAMGTPLIALSLLDSLQAQGLLTRVGGAVSLSPAAALGSGAGPEWQGAYPGSGGNPDLARQGTVTTTGCEFSSVRFRFGTMQRRRSAPGRRVSLFAIVCGTHEVLRFVAECDPSAPKVVRAKFYGNPVTWNHPDEVLPKLSTNVNKRFSPVLQPHQEESVGPRLQYLAFNLDHIDVSQIIPSVYSFVIIGRNRPGATHRAVSSFRSGDRGPRRRNRRCGYQQDALHGASLR